MKKVISIGQGSLKLITPQPYPKLSSKHRQHPTWHRLLGVLCATLLLESSILQLATTADGSEVAFNPSPATLLEMQADPLSGTGQVAGISEYRQIDPDSSTAKTESEPAAAPEKTSRSLITPAHAAAPTQPISSPNPIFRSPLRSYILTQYYSGYHPAIDMAAATGSPVYATTDGVVAATGYLLAGGGLMVKVNHDGGYSSYYAHLSAINTSIGQRVNNSTQIARVGSTGWATGPHLHFMVWKNQQALNPLALIK